MPSEVHLQVRTAWPRTTPRCGAAGFTEAAAPWQCGDSRLIRAIRSAAAVCPAAVDMTIVCASGKSVLRIG
jgi:hypothetical protein